MPIPLQASLLLLQAALTLPLLPRPILHQPLTSAIILSIHLAVQELFPRLFTGLTLQGLLLPMCSPILLTPSPVQALLHPCWRPLLPLPAELLTIFIRTRSTISSFQGLLSPPL